MTIPNPMRLPTAHKYEVLAFGIITMIVVVAAVRRARFFNLLVFMTAAATGASIAIVSLRPYENSFVPTFIGFLVGGIVVTAIISIVPDMLQVLKGFLRL